MASKNIGALWLRKTQDGVEYFSGVLDLLGEDIRIAVFYNDRKEAGTQQPDWKIVRSAPQEQSENQNSGRPSMSRQTEPEAQDSSVPSGKEEVNIEDIPF